jgi:hypothetical protein
MPEALPDTISSGATVPWIVVVDLVLDEASVFFVVDDGIDIELFEPLTAARVSFPLLLRLSAVETGEAEVVIGESAHTVTHFWLQSSSFSSGRGAVRAVTAAYSVRIIEVFMMY